MAGAALGSSAAKGASNKWNNHQYNKDTKQNEQVLASEYLAWSQEQGIDNEEGLLNRTEEIMNADLEKGNLSAGDLKYRQYLDSMSEQYKGAGDDDSVAKQHVLNTIKETQMGWIQPKEHESTGGYEKPISSEQKRRDDFDKVLEERRKNNNSQNNSGQGQNGSGGNPPTMDSI